MADDKTFTKADVDAAVAAAVAKIEDAIETEKAKNQGLLDDLKKAQREARAAKDIKPEDLQAAEDRAEKAEKDLAEATKAVKTLTGERDKTVKALETESAFTSKLLIQDGLKSALLASGVKDEDMIDVLSAKFAGQAAVESEGDARVAKIGGKPLTDHIKEWAASDAGKKFVSAPVNGGGGAPGGDGKGGGETKTMPRAEFDALPQVERSKFAVAGGKVVDA